MINQTRDTAQEQLLKDITAFLQKANISYIFQPGRYNLTKIEKHLIDAAFVYQIQKGNLDERYLTSWAKKHKTTELLKEIAIMDLEEHY